MCIYLDRCVYLWAAASAADPSCMICRMPQPLLLSVPLSVTVTSNTSPPTLQKDPLTCTVTSITFSHRHCHLQSLPLPFASFLIWISWHCHFQHLSLSLPPSLPHSLSPPVSLSLPLRLLVGLRARMSVYVCVCVQTFVHICTCICMHVCTCICMHAWLRMFSTPSGRCGSGRLRPSPAVSGRLRPSPALRERAALPPQTPPTLEKDPLTGTVTSIRFSHRHCHLQSLPLPFASFLICVSWHCHFQHLSLSLPPSLPPSLSLSPLCLCLFPFGCWELRARVRYMCVCVCADLVCTFARASACMCARASACTRGCGFSSRVRPFRPSQASAVSGRLRPSPAVSQP